MFKNFASKQPIAGVQVAKYTKGHDAPAITASVKTYNSNDAGTVIFTNAMELVKQNCNCCTTLKLAWHYFTSL